MQYVIIIVSGSSKIETLYTVLAFGQFCFLFNQTSVLCIRFYLSHIIIMYMYAVH